MKRLIELIDGIRAIPLLIDEVRGSVHWSACQTEFDRTFAEMNSSIESERATRQKAEAETEAVYERFRRALIGLGVNGSSIARFVDGEEIEGDFITARDTQIINECNKRQDVDRLLFIEKEAHKETKVELGLEKGAHRIANLAEERAESKLTSALETIDALTRWRLQSEEPCPETGEWIDYLDGACGRHSTRYGENIGGQCRWRHSPESWEATRKAGTEHD